MGLFHIVKMTAIKQLTLLLAGLVTVLVYLVAFGAVALLTGCAHDFNHGLW